MVNDESGQASGDSKPNHRRGSYPAAEAPRRRGAAHNRRRDDYDKREEAYTRSATEGEHTSGSHEGSAMKPSITPPISASETFTLEATTKTMGTTTTVRASTASSDDDRLTAAADEEVTPVILPPISKKTRPLICVTTQLGKRSSFPDDGLCDYLIFRDVTLGDGEWVSATSSGKLHPFLDRSSRSPKTIYMLSFPAKIHPEVKSFLRTNAVCVQLLRKYFILGIRGYGFASIDTDSAKLLKDAVNYWNIMKDLDKTMKSATSTGGITFLGLLLRGKRNAKVLGAIKEMIKHTDIFIAISHTPLPLMSSDCLVQPIASWSSEHLNDVTAPTLSSGLGLLRHNSNKNSTVVALSSSLGVLKFKTHPDSDRGIEGIWNVKCTAMALEAFQNECTARASIGSIGTNDYIVYDFDKSNRSWRSYETVDSLRAKIEKVFDELQPSPGDLIGWALYDVDLEDQRSTCNAVTSGKYRGNPNNRLMWVKEFLLDKKNTGTT